MSRIRLLLLGNSHLGALKLATKGSEKHPDVEIGFFGAPAHWTKKADLRDGVISTSHPPLAQKFSEVSGGSETVNLNEFDVVALVGMFFGFSECLREIRRAHTYTMPPLKPKSQLISQTCMGQLFEDLLKASAAYEWAEKIRSQFMKPVLIVPTPLSSETRLQNDAFLAPVAADFRPIAPKLFSMYRERARALAKAAGVTLVEQPDDTMAFPGFTKQHFSRGSLRLLHEAGHEESDFNHMNQEFGTVLLREIISAVRTSRAVSAPELANASIS